MQIIASLLTKLKIKSFCINNSFLLAVIEHRNINNQHPIVIANLESILGPSIKFSLDTKQFKNLLQTGKLAKVEMIEFNDMSRLAKDNVKGERLLYLINELGPAVSDFHIYAKNQTPYSINMPVLSDAKIIFKSKISKDKVTFINKSNIDAKFKNNWDLLIEDDELETIHHIDIAEPSCPVIAKIRDKTISIEQAHFVLRTLYLSSTTCRTEMEVSGIKTAKNEYSIISNFLYKELKVYIFEQAELIKFNSYTRSANYLETYVQTNNLKKVI